MWSSRVWAYGCWREAALPAGMQAEQQVGMQVLDELGIDAIAGAASAPKTRVPAAGAAQPARTQVDADVDKLLAELR